MAIPAGTSDLQKYANLWNGYSSDKQSIILSAVSAPYATKQFFFGSRKVKYNGFVLGKTPIFKGGVTYSRYHVPNNDGTYDIYYEYDDNGNRNKYYGGTAAKLGKFTPDDPSNPDGGGTTVNSYVNQPYYYFYNFTEDTANPTNIVSGPFADLESKIFNSDGSQKSTTYPFFDELLDIGDNSRYPSYRVEYGRRRRPLGGESGSGPRNLTFGNARNGIVNGSLTMLFASNNTSYNEYTYINDWPKDAATSYPSGHSSQCMTVALMLGQMYAGYDTSKIRQYVAAAYQLGVGRTITRHHWQSDVIYGRLCAMMILPIVNAMSNGNSSFMSNYETVKNAIVGSVHPTGTITMTIVNNTGKSFSVDSNGLFYIAWPGQGHNGVYFYLQSPRANVTLPVGPSHWSNVKVEGNSSDPIFGAPFENDTKSNRLYVSMSDHTNIMDANPPLATSVVISGEVDPVSGKSILVDGGFYTMTIS